MMRKLPTILAGLFLAITLVRVADFSAQAMRAGALGWLFSAGLGVAVYTTAYFARVSATDKDGEESERSKVARRSSIFALILFIVVDGFFNLSEVLRVVPELDLRIAAFVYGLFPTAAAGLLGYLQGHIDRLPVPPKRYSIGLSLRVIISRWLDSKAVAIQPVIEEPKTEVAPPLISAPERIFHCEKCSFTSANQRSLAAHARWAHKKESASV